MALSAPTASRPSATAHLPLLGFAGAFRRPELVALDVADREETEDGFKITIRRSKTDQEGHGVTIAIARGITACPVKTIKGVAAGRRHQRGTVVPPRRQGRPARGQGGRWQPIQVSGVPARIDG
jgi:hypothetical protein